MTHLASAANNMGYTLSMDTDSDTFQLYTQQVSVMGTQSDIDQTSNNFIWQLDPTFPYTTTTSEDCTACYPAIFDKTSSSTFTSDYTSKTLSWMGYSFTGYFGTDSLNLGYYSEIQTNSTTPNQPFFVTTSLDTTVADSWPGWWGGIIGLGLPNTNADNGPTTTLIQNQKA